MKNLESWVDKAKVYDVFSICGRVASVHVIRDGSNSRGMAIVTFTHPLEAIQSIKMMKTATFYSRKLETVQDLAGPVPTIPDQLPSGLANVAGGLGKNSEVVKVEYLDQDEMIHAPDCISQGDRPISHLESAILHNITHLGGVVLLQSMEGRGRLYETYPAQDFVNHIEAKIENLILTAHDYLEGNEVEGPHDRVEQRTEAVMQQAQKDCLHLYTIFQILLIVTLVPAA